IFSHMLESVAAIVIFPNIGPFLNLIMLSVCVSFLSKNELIRNLVHSSERFITVKRYKLTFQILSGKHQQLQILENILEDFNEMASYSLNVMWKWSNCFSLLRNSHYEVYSLSFVTTVVLNFKVHQFLLFALLIFCLLSEELQNIQICSCDNNWLNLLRSCFRRIGVILRVADVFVY
ncbi:hypothetical protein L9F63_019968, partial [Diploptera punctata]